MFREKQYSNDDDEFVLEKTEEAIERLQEIVSWLKERLLKLLGKKG